MAFTKSDKKFLKETFLTKENGVTKDDLAAMEKRQDATYASKDDAKQRHDAVITKLNALEKHIESVDKGLETLNDSLVPILGNIHEWTDEIHNEVVKERLLKRVKRLEKHLGLPSLAD